MKWFVKALRHYADFSGRARRKEYWMFALFNLIFLFMWAFLIALFAGGNYDEETLPLVFQLSWFGLLGLPGLAVAVRRLHDLGKSGWMMLIGLIPFVGGIWLLILLATDGQTGGNRFGPDPKTSPETFDDKAKLTSAGIATIIGASLTLLSTLLSLGMVSPLASVQEIVLGGLLLAVGIALIGSGEREKAKTALWPLLAFSGIMALMNLVSGIRMMQVFGGIYIVERLVYFLFGLALALLATVLLFARGNRNFLRSSALAAIILAGFMLLLRVRMLGVMSPDSLNNILHLLTFIQPVAYMILAWTFLSEREERPSVVDLSPETEFPSRPLQAAEREVVYRPSSDGKPGIKKPTPVWAIVGFAVTFVLFLLSIEQMEQLWFLFLFFIIGDLVALGQYINRKKAYEKMMKDADGTPISGIPLAEPATIRVVRDSSIVGAIIAYKVYLNNQFVGKIGNGKSLDIITSVSHNIVMVFDNQDNPFAGDFKADLEAGGYTEVHVKAGRFVKKQAFSTGKPESDKI
jgi:uncharacterized membrane protein YhaH (DUF805 family)